MSVPPLLWESCVCYQEGRTDNQLFEEARAPFVPCFRFKASSCLSHQRSHSVSPFRVAGFDGNDTGVGGGGSKSATKEENITDREDGEEQRQSSSRG